MTELTERQRFLLSLVIHEYVRSAAPVGSKHVVDEYNLEMSSATVRNEMSALTDLGYLRQPHLSAGRVPTEDGYRLYVSNIVQETELPDATRRTITHQFYQMRQDVEGWTRLAASVLAHQSRAASLVTAPHPEESRFKHLELIAARGRQVLMVLVMMGGEILQRFITLVEPVSQEQLSNVADRFNALFTGHNFDEISSDPSTLNPLEQDFYQAILGEMEQADSMISGDVVLDGLTNVLAEPEFSTSGEARRGGQVGPAHASGGRAPTDEAADYFGQARCAEHSGQAGERCSSLGDPAFQAIHGWQEVHSIGVGQDGRGHAQEGRARSGHVPLQHAQCAGTGPKPGTGADGR